MKIKMISTKACETSYEVEHEGKVYPVRLYAITGGQIALWFTNPPFEMKRYNTSPLYSNDNWIKEQGLYKHQTPGNVVGPNLGDLEGGEATLNAFVVEVAARKKLYHERLDRLTEILGQKKELISKRFHMEEERTYFKIEFAPFYGETFRVSPITVDSGSYGWSRIEEKMTSIIEPFWFEANNLIEGLRKREPNALLIHDLSEAGFETYFKAIKIIAEGLKYS